MEDKLYKLEVRAKIKKAISIQYCEIQEVSSYHEYMELLIDFEELVLKNEN